jgi:hypothetical protein
MIFPIATTSSGDESRLGSTTAVRSLTSTAGPAARAGTVIVSESNMAISAALLRQFV